MLKYRETLGKHFISVEMEGNTNMNIVLATRSNYANFKKARAKDALDEPAYEEKTWWNKKSAKYQGAIKRYAPNK